MDNGNYIIGTLKGYSESPWSNPQKGTSGINRRIGVVTNEYKDEWGETQQTVQNVDILEADAITIKAVAEKLRGKKVVVPVVFRARAGGRQGAFLSCFMPRDSEIYPASMLFLDEQQQPKAVNQ